MEGLPRSAPDLETARLTLEPFSEADLDELHALFNDADVRRHLLDDEVVTSAWVVREIRASHERFADTGAGLWSARLRHRERIVGFAGFRPFFEPAELQLLYGFLPETWGRGLATEAAAAVIAHGFEALGLEEIRAATDVPNDASIRVLERLGMVEVGRTDAGPHGTVFYELARARAEGSAGAGVSAPRRRAGSHP